jgi:Tol biopolymer transport system component
VILLLSAIVVAVALSVLSWRQRQRPGATISPPRVVPLTAMRGFEDGPTFSPDGAQVAFSWTGETTLYNVDVYVKMVGSSEVHRLTTEPAEDWWPSWSPDGRLIAFVRMPSPIEDSAGAIHLVSPLGGGSERKLSDLRVGPYRPSWTPDGQWLAATHAPSAKEDMATGRGLYLVSLRGEAPRRLTRAPPLGDDVAPAFSWDGRRLAYATCLNLLGLGPCDVYVLDLGSGFLPASPPRRLTRQGLGIHGLAWARDGASVVYQGYVGMELGRLWRVGVDGRSPPEPIEVAGDRVASPAVAPMGDRLAFASRLFSRAIYRFVAGGSDQPFLASSLSDGASQFSPDGRRIAFDSLRSGETSEIWVAASDGRNPVQLTHGPGRWQGSPYWSPDGRRIAFDSQGLDGRWDIWTIDVGGASPRRLTQHPGNENVPQLVSRRPVELFRLRSQRGPGDLARAR